jgi:hypothetical protein
MEVAADVLHAVDPSLQPPTSVREGEFSPQAVLVEPGRLADELPALVRAEADAVGDGTVAVLLPAGRLTELRAVLAEALPDLAAVRGDQLSRRVAVLPVREAKGLEFDAVVVVDPAAVLAASHRGANDLYVAVTRATQRLTVVTDTELPDVLAGLAVRSNA